MFNQAEIRKFTRSTPFGPSVGRLYRQFFGLPSLPPRRKSGHKQHIGDILEFENIPIVPYEHLMDHPRFPIHRGGPVLPHWEKQYEARYCMNGYPADARPRRPLKLSKFLEEPCVWCGPIVKHFGHQIADFSTRILHSKSIFPNVKFLFSVKPNSPYTSLEKTPPFFQFILHWYGIHPSQVEIICCPTLTRHLHIAPQAEQLDSFGPSGEYLDLLDDLVKRRSLKKKSLGTVFVSRAGISTHFAGESYMERLFSHAGYYVMRPEKLSLQEQLEVYNSAEHLIFSEGSAVHGLQLLGRSIGHVHILNRRPGFTLARDIINIRAKSLAYEEVTQKLIHGLAIGGQAEVWRGIPVLREEVLLQFLTSLTPEVAKAWDHQTYLIERDADIKAWIMQESKRANAKVPRAKEMILWQLKAAGLDDCLAFAEEQFSSSEVSFVWRK